MIILSLIVHAAMAEAAAYEHRGKGFSCTVPDGGWQISESSSGARWVTADESAVLSVQHMADINVAITPEYLEELFNGFDNVDRKELIESERGTLNGHPAYASVRRHENGVFTKMTVLVVGQRGFSINLTTSEIGHTKFGHIYDQMVTSFRAQAGSAPQAAQEKHQAASKGNISSPALPHLFRGRGLGFTVNYPKGWEATRLDDTTVQILGPGHSDDNRIEALIMVQGHPGAGDTPESLMEKLRAQILGDYPDAKFSPAKDFVLAGGRLSGQQCVAEYYEAWEKKRQWQGIMRKDDGSYIVMFVAGPQAVMMANVPNIDKIINSLSPTR
jgi:hypothetical protein